VLLANKINQL